MHLISGIFLEYSPYGILQIQGIVMEIMHAFSYAVHRQIQRIGQRFQLLLNACLLYTSIHRYILQAEPHINMESDLQINKNQRKEKNLPHQCGNFCFFSSLFVINT